MSLVLYKQPRLLDFAGNNLFLQIKGTDYLLTSGVKALLSFPAISVPAFGTLMYIKMMGTTHIFKLVDKSQPIPVPVYPVNHIIPITGVLSSLITEIAAGIVSYPIITQYYDVTTDGILLYIMAKEDGSAYNIHFDGDYGLPSFVPPSIGTVLGVDPETRPDYFFSISLFVENLSTKGTYKALPEFRLDPNSTQLVAIDNGKVIRRRFRDFFDLPDFAATVPVKVSYAHINFYYIIKEMSGATLLSSVQTAVFKALNGRVNKSDHANIDIREWMVNKKRFLTNMPGQIATFGGAKAMLYYLNPFSGTSNIVVKMTIAQTAGDDITYTYPFNNLAQDDVVMIPVDGIIATLMSDSSLIRFAEVWVESATGVLLAGKQTYHYRPKGLFDRSMVFQNQYGMFDAIITIQQKSELSTQANQATATLTPDFSRYVGDIAAAHPEITDVVTAQTGPITHDMAAHIKELAASRVVFLAHNDRYIRVSVEPGSFATVDESKELCNVTFKFSPAFSGDLLSTPADMPIAKHKDYSEEYLESDYQ